MKICFQKYACKAPVLAPALVSFSSSFCFAFPLVVILLFCYCYYPYSLFYSFYYILDMGARPFMFDVVDYLQQKTEPTRV